MRHFLLRGRLPVVACALAVGLGWGPAASAEAEPPEDVDFLLHVGAGDACTFPIDIHLTGKSKTIEHGGVLVIAPGQSMTVTNADDPSRQITISITGAFHTSMDADGTSRTKATGRNALFDPVAGFVLAIGDFHYAFDVNGTLTEPLNGRGRVLDICELVGP